MGQYRWLARKIRSARKLLQATARIPFDERRRLRCALTALPNIVSQVLSDVGSYLADHELIALGLERVVGYVRDGRICLLADAGAAGRQRSTRL